MFSFRKPSEKTTQASAIFKITGMHCSSCVMNIDGLLEETPGVVKASTSYAKAQTKVVYNPQQIDSSKLREMIHSAGYNTVI